MFGCNQSGQESVLLKRRVMIPCWLSLKHPTRLEASAQVQPFGLDSSPIGLVIGSAFLDNCVLHLKALCTLGHSNSFLLNCASVAGNYVL